jgi:hypothetical protein
MYSFSAAAANSHFTTRIHTTRIHPMLTGIADEIRGTLARLIAYLMMLALIAIGAIAAWNQLPDAIAMAPVSQFNLQDKTEPYRIWRHFSPAPDSSASPADWLTGADDPRLRGTL